MTVAVHAAVAPEVRDQEFSGSVPRLYESHLVPLIFRSYAADLVRRVAARPGQRVLEIAAGTGAVTRSLARILPQEVSIVATDLSQPMLDTAAAVGTARPVEWRQADAMQLPFEDATFDTVVCQFGVMFFPDKSRAFAEAGRVLRKGGALIFNVWDRIEENEFAFTVSQALEQMFPTDPPNFMSRTPHGYHDLRLIEQHLNQGGFLSSPLTETIAARSKAESPRIPAVAFCQGTPMRNEIEARDPSRLGEATERAALALAKRFGSGPVDGKIQAHVISIER